MQLIGQEGLLSEVVTCLQLCKQQLISSRALCKYIHLTSYNYVQLMAGLALSDKQVTCLVLNQSRLGDNTVELFFSKTIEQTSPFRGQFCSVGHNSPKIYWI